MAKWITHPASGRNEGFFVFVKSFELEYQPKSVIVRVCADTVYRLFVNGVQENIGPCKESDGEQYWDVLDVARHLRYGKNEVRVLLMHLPEPERDGKYYNTLHRGPYALLALKGTAADVPLDTDESWLVSTMPERTLRPEDPDTMAIAYETVHFRQIKRTFLPARVLRPVQEKANPFGELPLKNLHDRPIPLLTYEEKAFRGAPRLWKADNNTLVLDAGEETTGTVAFFVRGKRGSSVTLTYAEAYRVREGEQLVKRVRDDASGELTGCTDKVFPDAEGHGFETFSIRAFRYILIEVHGKAELSDFRFYEIKYPFTVEASFASSDPDAKALWDVSVRTLSCCMHDSFEDCPYYEQLQYVMDSRLEALFLRQLTRDRALIFKCANDFALSRLPDGMIQARTPSNEKQIIPGFALHYVFMLHDIMVYDGEKERLKALLPVIDGIFAWFERHEKDGVLGAVDGWNYLDWVSGWTNGVPGEGGLAVYHFMLVSALDKAARIAHYCGRIALSEEYAARAARMRQAGKDAFFDAETGYFFDTTERASHSLHGQVWAVLSDTVGDADAGELLARALADENLPKCSYSMMFYVFRALEKAGRYDLAYPLLDAWRKMLALHCTTWVEAESGPRSECHGWGSVPLYEFTHVILGVRPAENGYESIKIQPYVQMNEYANGTVSTRFGTVSVKWKKENGRLLLQVENKTGKPARVILPDGSFRAMQGEKGAFVCRIR